MTGSNQLYQFPQFSFHNFPNTGFDFNSLLDKELSGFVVNDFLSSAEIKKIKDGFRAIAPEKLIQINSSFYSYPISFAQFDQMVRGGQLKEEEYFNSIKLFIQNFETQFGVHILKKIQTLFSYIKNAPIPVPAPDVNGNREYAPFTFRELFPGEGRLKAHCENLFYKEFPGFFERMGSFSVPENQLSFFIVIQSPGRGGELTLYDLIWDDKQTRPTDTDVQLADGSLISFESPQEIKQQQISPESGSLVVFSGGEIWHRVETVLNAPSRITLGGFLSFSKDKSKLYSWS